MNDLQIQGIKRTTIFVDFVDALVLPHSAKTVPHVCVDQHFLYPVSCGLKNTI